MLIFIRTLVGKKNPYTVESTWSTSRLKELLQEKEGIDVNQIRLIYGGKQMEDTRSIESYEMQAGSTIHMILQLRGG